MSRSHKPFTALKGSLGSTQAHSLFERTKVADILNSSLTPSISGQCLTSQMLEREAAKLEKEMWDLEAIRSRNKIVARQVALMAEEDVRGDRESTLANRKLESENMAAGEQLKIAENEVKLRYGEVEALDEEVERMCEDFERREEAWGREELEAEAFENAAEEVKEEISELEGQLTELVISKKGLEDVTESLRNEIEEVKERRRNTGKQNVSLRAATEEIEKTITRLDRESLELENLSIRRRKEATDLDIQTGFIMRERQAAEERNGDLELEINQLRLKLGQLKGRGLCADAEKQEHQRELEGLRERKVDLISKIENRRAEIKRFEMILDEMDEQVFRSHKKNSEIGSRKQECLEEMDRLTGELQKQRVIGQQVRQLVQSQKYLSRFLKSSKNKNSMFLKDL